MKRLPGVVYAAVAAVAVSAATLSGCGSDNPYELPQYQSGEAGQPSGAPSGDSAGGPSASADPGAGNQAGAATGEPSGPTPSGTEPIPTVPRQASPGSTAVTYTPADEQGEGAWVERGKVKARTPQAKAAVAAVVAYMGQRVQISNTWTVDEAALAAVATGQARTSAQERAAEQQAAGRRSIGRFVVNVSSVKVRGAQATVIGCDFDSTAEVDANGYVLVPPPGGLLITMEVQYAQGVWKVTSWPTKKAPTCTGWKK
jgi:hypothetical protein